jgi:hypothetical protein
MLVGCRPAFPVRPAVAPGLEAREWNGNKFTHKPLVTRRGTTKIAFSVIRIEAQGGRVII